MKFTTGAARKQLSESIAFNQTNALMTGKTGGNIFSKNSTAY
jgi:hypothetical protein